MYKVRISFMHTIEVQGQAVDVGGEPLSLRRGWNWLPHLHQSATTLNLGLPAHPYRTGDIIKSIRSFATFYVLPGWIGWFGTLDVLIPGQGYLLQVASGSDG